MQPGQQQGERLQGRGPAAIGPQRQQDIGVAVLGLEELMIEPRGQHMVGQQRDRREAQDQLQRLGPADPGQAPVVVERPQRQQVVDGERAVQQHGCRHVAPCRQEPAPPLLHRFQRPQPKRMVEQVRKHIGEQHQPGHQPRPANPWPQIGGMSHRRGRRGGRHQPRPVFLCAAKPGNGERGGHGPPLPLRTNKSGPVSSRGIPPAGRTCGRFPRPRGSRCRTAPRPSSCRWFPRRCCRPASPSCTSNRRWRR